MLGWDRVSVEQSKRQLQSIRPLIIKYLYLWRLCSLVANSANILQVPKAKTNYMKRSFGYSGAVLWNGLPSELREPLSLASFKKGLDDFFRQRAPTRQTRKTVF